MLTHGQERFFFHKVTSVSIPSFVEWLDTFSYVLRPADVTVKEVNHIRCFEIDIAKRSKLSKRNRCCRFDNMARLITIHDFSPVDF